jgi:phosphatidylglycerophosphate synthase
MYVHFIESSPVKLWGLTSRQRLLRVLSGADVTEIVNDFNSLPENGSVLLFRGDYLFDDRLVDYLMQTPGLLLKIPQTPESAIVAAHVSSGQVLEARDIIENTVSSSSLTGVKIETLETLSISFQQRLLKSEPPFVLPITPEGKRDLERKLFNWSYKGVTDLVTKWAWPHPARWAVGQCVRLGLSPNHVTIQGLILVALAGMLFAYGLFGWGLLAGWLMTFLDTVDGKLARVTVTSSRFGHYFDHIIDLVHPPVWYIMWGLGLEIGHNGVWGLSFMMTSGLIVTGYLAGRLVEGVFTIWLGKFGIFCWQPVDSYFRLITARRNPCLILLTLGTLAGRPDLGLFAVAIWTVLSSIFLLGRLAMAGYTRMQAGRLASWFLGIDPSSRHQTLAVRLFTQNQN